MTTASFEKNAIDSGWVETGQEGTETGAGNTFMQIVPSEPTSRQMLRLMELSGALDFWNSPGQDIYSLDDGDPV